MVICRSRHENDRRMIVMKLKDMRIFMCGLSALAGFVLMNGEPLTITSLLVFTGFMVVGTAIVPKMVMKTCQEIAR
jgi:hypothetical protein